MGSHLVRVKNGKTRFLAPEVDPGATNKKKPRYEPRKTVANQAQAVKIALTKSWNNM